ncbi:MAG: hypothetical protein KDA41_15615, partial [Planctomycetales bacterium]|nr:hypothetical protein [Planctomycetales bacterium]
MSGLAFVRVERARLETTGADRVKFLHNFCTADVRRLTPGQGAEAFLLNVKGKILAYALAYVADDKIVLDCAAQRALPLSAHLDRYTLTDDVAVADVSSDWAQLVLLGQAAEELLTSAIAGEAPRSAHDFRRANLGGATIELARGSLAGPQSWTLWVAADKAQDVAEQLVALGGRACDAAELEVARIEAGMPLDGVDVTDDNLPQEVNRNAQAISFTKGCYLGQEVVARIDALGHV